MLANGTKLGYSKTAPSGSSTSYTDLPGLKEIPDVGTDPEKVDNTVYIWYNVSIKYRRCFYDRTTAEIDAKSIHGNI